MFEPSRFMLLRLNFDLMVMEKRIKVGAIVVMPFGVQSGRRKFRSRMRKCEGTREDMYDTDQCGGRDGTSVGDEGDGVEVSGPRVSCAASVSSPRNT